MKALPTLIVFLAAASLCSGSALAADRNWIVQAGGGSAYASLDGSTRLARSLSAAVVTDVSPWMLFGLESSWYGIGEQFALDDVGQPVQLGGSDAFSLGTSFSLQVPVKRGIAPFVVATSGVSVVRWGELTEYRTIRPWLGPGDSDAATSGTTEGLWSSSAGVGVRVVLPQRWPDVEVSARKVAWIGNHTYTFVEPRLTLSF